MLNLRSAGPKLDAGKTQLHESCRGLSTWIEAGTHKQRAHKDVARGQPLYHVRYSLIPGIGEGGKRKQVEPAQLESQPADEVVRL